MPDYPENKCLACGGAGGTVGGHQEGPGGEGKGDGPVQAGQPPKGKKP